MPYFHYRSLDELRADALARAIALPLSEDLASLAQPVRIGGFVASNRMAVHPMEGCDGNVDGTPGELTFRRWRRFAEGGAAVVWGEATAVVPEARANPRQLLISRETALELKRLLTETRDARRARFGGDEGFIVGVQLTHSGRWSHAGPIITQHGGAIDAVKHCEQRPLLSDAELERLIDRFVEAATLARDIGFDFVDIKQCHTYLLNELLGARSRQGAFGGSFEHRTRFVRDVFARIRDRLGDSIAVATRMNVFDGVPYTGGPDGIGWPAAHDVPYVDAWGTDLDDPTRPDLGEPLRLIGELRELGLSMLNVSTGSPYYNAHIGRPFEKPPVDGYTPPEHPLAGVARHFALAEQVQRAYPDLPVIGTGYSWLRHFAMHAGAANVASGAITMVGLGRGALAYPDFAADVLDGTGMQRDKSCIGVSYCTALMRAKHNAEGQYPTGCVPRDRLYADAFREARRTEGWQAVGAPPSPRG
ncbi:MAG: NADH:flavin oxidoreductase [Chloroflexota bacterium]|nr:NADH:flavin oxidoreductase [Chloroflexota bacterium]